MNVSGSRNPSGSSTIVKSAEAAKRAAFKESILKKNSEQGKSNNKANNITSGSSKASVTAANSSKKTNKNQSRKRVRSKANKSQEVIEGFKVTIRLLPPNLTEEKFWEIIHDYITENLIFSKYYFPGHYSIKPFKAPTYSRAYISFKEAKIADEFVKAFKALPFEDDKESTIAQFTQSLYGPMPIIKPESTISAPKSQSKNVIKSLEDHPSFQMFLKVQNNELEPPQTYILKPKVISRLLNNNCDFQFLNKKSIETGETIKEKPKKLLKRKKEEQKTENVEKGGKSSKKKEKAKSKSKSSKTSKDSTTPTPPTIDATDGKQSKQKKSRKKKAEDREKTTKKETPEQSTETKTTSKLKSKKQSKKETPTTPASTVMGTEQTAAAKQKRAKQPKAKSDGNTSSNASNTTGSKENKQEKSKPTEGNNITAKPKVPKILKKETNCTASTNNTVQAVKPKVMLMRRNVTSDSSAN